MNTAGIADARDRVHKIKEWVKKGYTLEKACNLERTTVKDYKATVDYLNKNGFDYQY